MTFVPIVRPINVRRDILSVTRIDRESFDQFWSPTDFANRLSGPDPRLQGVVAEFAGHISGFALFRNTSREIVLHRLAVADQLRRRGIGQSMIDAICEMHRHCREAVTALVDERDLHMQLFLRSSGFHWTATLKGHFAGSDSDKYRMVRRLTSSEHRRLAVLVDSCS